MLILNMLLVAITSPQGLCCTRFSPHIVRSLSKLTWAAPTRAALLIMVSGNSITDWQFSMAQAWLSQSLHSTYPCSQSGSTQSWCKPAPAYDPGSRTLTSACGTDVKQK